ncbi:hypothetical protein [Azospirillum rugosum]|uniref:Uncharacterized protein n=1 Tax=Azospirillum rugosum TaxID=416170 RepID=A0ABS4SG81_9PROT|nr:hypothetical protein [Azospirillum rugosum]MBP2291561.1 hypothetical protein [Azospirillum rugosum]MDQ0524627.1 hypothetical protein [Azospirillum rugosum]
MVEPPTEEQLRQLRRVVKQAQALGVPSVGGVRTDTLAWLMERAGLLEPTAPPKHGAAAED